MKDRQKFQGLLNGWFGDETQEWQLLHKASRENFSAAAFHRNCDGHAPTFTLVQVKRFQTSYPASSDVLHFFFRAQSIIPSQPPFIHRLIYLYIYSFTLRKGTPRLRRGTPSYEREHRVTRRNIEVSKSNTDVTKRNTELRKRTPMLRKGTWPRLRKGVPSYEKEPFPFCNQILVAKRNRSYKKEQNTLQKG